MRMNLLCTYTGAHFSSSDPDGIASYYLIQVSSGICCYIDEVKENEIVQKDKVFHQRSIRSLC